MITICNPAAARLLGLPASKVVGRTVEEFVTSQCREAESTSLRRTVAGEEVEPYRGECCGRGGSVVKVSAYVSPILDAAGVIVGAATRLRRISGLHQVHERFEIRADERRADLQDAAQPTRQPTTRRSPRASRAPAAIAATQGRADVNAFSVSLPPALIRSADRDGSTAGLT